MLVTFDCESTYVSKSGIIHKPYLKSLKDTIFSLIIFINKSFLHLHYKTVAFFVFVNMGPYGSENLKMRLLLQIAAERFQTFPEFSSQWSSQNQVWDF